MKTFLSFLLGLFIGLSLGSYIQELAKLCYEAFKVWLAS